MISRVPGAIIRSPHRVEQRPLGGEPLGQRDVVPQLGRVRRVRVPPRRPGRRRRASTSTAARNAARTDRLDRRPAEVLRDRDPQRRPVRRLGHRAGQVADVDRASVARRAATGPAITGSASAASRTVRVSGPSTDRRRPAAEARHLRDQAERRLVPDHAAERRRDPDRAAAVGAQRDRRRAVRHRRPGAAARAARACGPATTGCGSGRTRRCRCSRGSRTPGCWSCRRRPRRPPAAGRPGRRRRRARSRASATRAVGRRLRRPARCGP